MNECCDSNIKKNPKRHTCPENCQPYLEVPKKTILHHLKEPWNFSLQEKAYYFCHDPDCNIVYFGLDEETIHKNQLRTKVGLKETSFDELTCYCFGISKSEAKNNTEAKQFVIEQTKLNVCTCITSNPSGRCCLKDFPKK